MISELTTVEERDRERIQRAAVAAILKYPLNTNSHVHEVTWKRGYLLAKRLMGIY